MRRLAMWSGAVLMGVMAMGADPAPSTPPPGPRAMPPLPVPPVERRAMTPYFARFTISGEPRISGEFEVCSDPASAVRSAEGRAARPADAPPPLTGCTTANQVQPGGAIHTEISCDPAKGAKTAFHMVRDGTPNDMRMHTEVRTLDPATGVTKTVSYQSHFVRLGSCPADLQPGQMRRLGGPIIEKAEASRILDSALGMAR